MDRKFTQFKKMESELEEIPHVKPEVHFKLNDISKRISSGKEIDRKDIDSLELIYSELQDLEKSLVSNLDDYRSKGIVQKEEFLITINFFLVAKQNGPETSQLLNIFKNKNLSVGDCTQLIDSISIPEHTKIVLLNVYSKIISE
ncbi:MAG: hypothetical protein V4665_02670 [Patescibacteria group bacterium]